MITFDDVKKTTETTFFFFPDGMQEEFWHFLRLALGTDFDGKILSYAQMRAQYPDVTIPTIPFDRY